MSSSEDDMDSVSQVTKEAQSASEDVIRMKNKRKQLRSKITRARNRLHLMIDDDNQNERRIKRVLEEIKSDFSQACEVHGELYNHVPRDQTARLDQWEVDLSNEVYDIEDKVSDFLSSITVQAESSRTRIVERETTASRVDVSSSLSVSGVLRDESQDVPPVAPDHQHSQAGEISQSHQQPLFVSDSTGRNVARFDKWIDDLVEFAETVHAVPISDMSISEALYKLEASKDIPTIKLEIFNGNALSYVDFIERFKIHIHDKMHLSDDMRMIQLRMHTSGEAERAISGLGSSGIMYVTALKCLKDQFGQYSAISRACLKRLTIGLRIAANDRQSLRDFSLDIIHCQATFRRIGYCADANASENLRKVIGRLPDFMINKWKVIVVDIRERGRIPTLDEISSFIRKQVKAEFDPEFGDLEQGGKLEHRQGYRDKRKGIHAAQEHVQTGKGQLKCYVCLADHRVTVCPTFLDSLAEERLQLAKEHRLCFSCLTRGHCSSACRSKRRCSKSGCDRSHHSLLHVDIPQVSGVSSILDRNGIMPVVRVAFRSPTGRIREGNVLIDSGAGTTVIRSDFAKSLGLQGRKERLNISVVGGEKLEQPESRRLSFFISPIGGGEEHRIEAHEIDQTILSVPPLNREWLKSLSHLKDIDFPHKAGPVDLILGVQYSHLHVDNDKRQGLPFEPIAKQTRLGWCVLGSDNVSGLSSIGSIGFVEKVNLDTFYALETLGVQAPDCSCEAKAMSPDDRRTMELFKESCKKEGDRYVIGLPWKCDPSLLQDNFTVAEKRLFSLEKSLLKSPERAKLYDNAINEYLEHGWAVELTAEELASNIKPVYYLPHHGIYRPEKKSTPLRVVFDPACLFKGVCLNSYLHKGPCLIGNLLGVLLRFRERNVAFTGDISKMYLQILLPESDTHVHRFLWRNLDSEVEPKIHRLLRVTFGDKPSPDMASYVILHMADEMAKEFPQAADILRRDRYVDDLIHSCATEEEALKRMGDLDKILSTGGFKIKKWFCSSNLQHDSAVEISLDREENVKTLGVVWRPGVDTIRFRVKDADLMHFTKRSVLSRISAIYDPLGLASVVTIKARVAIQDIWRIKDLDWDTPLPQEMCILWQHLLQDIEGLRGIEFPRSLIPPNAIGCSELHVFADASASAYGAVAYLLWPTCNGSEVRLVSAKARVAPLRQTTIPRLELMAALIASRLAKTIVEEFQDKPEKVVLWTDSQIVLHWLRKESLKMKPFVGVRIAEIQSFWESDVWRFVPTDLNPADDLSRGLPVKEITGRWTCGPSFLRQPREEWPVLEIKAPATDNEIKKPKPVCMISRLAPVIDPSKFSDWKKLVRVTAYVFRFINNIRRRSGNFNEKRKQEELQPDEVVEAEKHWLLVAQQDLVDWESRHKDLTPFVNEDIVRVGGRLRRSPLTYDQVHPILLPAGHYISRLIMRDQHEKMGHSGQARTLDESRRKVWIIRGRSMAKSVVRSCVVCRKLRQPPHTTLMADLPPERMQPFSPPYQVTGVDLFGPFLLKYGRNKSTKAWGALFTCATVRAVHLEIVDGLSSSAFLHAFRRFASHHGWPSTVISDNGTSFVGAEKELRKLVYDDKHHLEEFASSHGFKWKFITPLSPHQGGMYESLIKQVKRGIQVAIGQQLLTWNEMSTVFAEVESLINSRPIGFASNSPDDLRPLTPNHFLLGRASADIPQGPFQETKNLLKRFEFVQALVFQFWKRFVREYVPSLMKRGKWQSKGRQMKVGDIVLLTDPDVPRGKWSMARILNVHPGSDGIVRNVTVRTKSGEYRRLIQRCCLILEMTD